MDRMELMILAIVVMLAAGILTWLVGNSHENKRKNPDYDKKTNKNWFRLALFYAVAVFGAGIILIYVVF